MEPSRWERAKYGAAMGGAVGLCIGLVFGGLSAMRYRSFPFVIIYHAHLAPFLVEKSCARRSLSFRHATN